MSRHGLATFAIALLGVAGCSAGSAADTTAPAGSDLVVRAAQGIQWNASEYAATSRNGQLVVTLINDASQPHNLHIVDEDGHDVDPGAKAPVTNGQGDVATVTFRIAPGTYRVVCQVPGHYNMDSLLLVD
jgi:plastocyanin